MRAGADCSPPSQDWCCGQPGVSRGEQHTSWCAPGQAHQSRWPRHRPLPAWRCLCPAARGTTAAALGASRLVSLHAWQADVLLTRQSIDTSPPSGTILCSCDCSTPDSRPWADLLPVTGQTSSLQGLTWDPDLAALRRRSTHRAPPAATTAARPATTPPACTPAWALAPQQLPGSLRRSGAKRPGALACSMQLGLHSWESRCALGSPAMAPAGAPEPGGPAGAAASGGAGGCGASGHAPAQHVVAAAALPADMRLPSVQSPPAELGAAISEKPGQGPTAGGAVAAQPVGGCQVYLADLPHTAHQGCISCWRAGRAPGRCRIWRAAADKDRSVAWLRAGQAACPAPPLAPGARPAAMLLTRPPVAQGAALHATWPSLLAASGAGSGCCPPAGYRARQLVVHYAERLQQGEATVAGPRWDSACTHHIRVLCTLAAARVQRQPLQ